MTCPYAATGTSYLCCGYCSYYCRWYCHLLCWPGLETFYKRGSAPSAHRYGRFYSSLYGNGYGKSHYSSG